MTKIARRKTKSSIACFESYLFRIEKLLPHYSFGTDQSTLATGPYADYHHTEIEAVGLHPQRVDGRTVIFTLMADRGLDQVLEGARALSYVPLGVGTLTIRREQSNYLGSLPYRAALSIPGLILSGGYRVIRLSGDALRYGSARIRSISFDHDLSPEEL